MEWEAKAQQAFVALPKREGEDRCLPLLSPIVCNKLDQPRSAPQKADFNVSFEVFHPRPRRRSLTPKFSGSKSSPASQLAPIDTKLNHNNEPKGLGISTSQSYSGVGTPPRSPRLPGFQHAHAPRPSQPRQAGSLGPTPLSPRIPSVVPRKLNSAASIKDFDMLKLISKGAFGQVWMAKKKTMGHYYAIKIFKKQDMIAKTQIMNVNLERKILMNQANSDFQRNRKASPAIAGQTSLRLSQQRPLQSGPGRKRGPEEPHCVNDGPARRSLWVHCRDQGGARGHCWPSASQEQLGCFGRAPRTSMEPL
ncbi:hypothetical protein PCASD_12456 [Puccinia coronata f. sp. avenae]|uniref:non-specific serine/threonine protein kinase n=1 Tax=Puccinia coronata f. sp. avenae TaxID=200324 RepID=A0A2N5U053_9BASI|nr:hypothetical protein PCASD_12456 [Puccinia coronata f. sp. avenae]